MKHPAWQPICDLLNEHGLKSVVDTLGRIVRFDAMQRYESPTDVPQLDADVINVAAKHRITTVEDLVDAHWLDDLMTEDEASEVPEHRSLIDQLLDALGNDVLTDAPEKATSVTKVETIAEALRRLRPKTTT